MTEEKGVNTEIFADRLRNLMEENNETTRSIAEVVHLSHSTISRYLKSKISPKVPTIEKLANYFGVNPVWLLGYDVPKKREADKHGFEKVPVLGCIAAGQPVFAKKNIKGYEKVPADQVKDGKYFYLEVTGDSMINAGIYDGDMVLVKKQDDISNKDIAVVMVNAHDATVKRVYINNGTYILHPENPKYDPIVIESKEARIIGKVVALTRKFE